MRGDLPLHEDAEAAPEIFVFRLEEGAVQGTVAGRWPKAPKRMDRIRCWPEEGAWVSTGSGHGVRWGGQPDSLPYAKVLKIAGLGLGTALA